MENLHLIDYDQKYIEYIEKIPDLEEELKVQFITLLKEEDIPKRKVLWNALKVSINAIKQVPKLANPYFIGFGNPNSNILFLGKEKAFDIHSSPEGFFDESINNTLCWKLISRNEFVNLETLDPLNPRKKYTAGIKKVHTWGKYAQILAELDKIDMINAKVKLEWENLIKPYEENDNNTLFDYCFMSEINHIPSKYSNGVVLNEERMKFLQNPFYRKFKYVVIGAMGYLNENDINEMFGIIEPKNTVVLDKIGRNKEVEFTADIFKREGQIIVYCKQLSGASGWSNRAINELVKVLKQNANP